MSRQSKNSRVLALARRFSAQRKAGDRQHNALSRRQLDPATRVKYTAKANPTTPVAKRQPTITHKH